MHITRLSLVDFRSWPRLDVPLAEGPVVFVGRNGAGKTNLVEAVGYLSGLSSHRVAGDGPLIRRGCAQALIRAVAVSAGRELTVEIELNAGAANRARINRAPQRRPRDILGVIRSVTFAPEDLALVRGDPSDRRRFLDELMVMRRPRLAGLRSDYEKVLRQRSTLLKSAGAARRSGAELTTLDVWDEHLAITGGELMAARLELVDLLTPFMVAAYESVAPESGPAGLWYRSSMKDAVSAAERDPELLAEALREQMARLRPAELERGVCLVGPHRDDLDLLLGEGLAKGYASHGESWSIALSLRLASWQLLRDDGPTPVLILDDVFAELDSARRSALAAVAGQADQTLITAAVAGDLPDELAAHTICIDGGAIEAVAP